MNIRSTCLAFLAMLAAMLPAGCNLGGGRTSAPMETHAITIGDFSVRIEAPKRFYSVGERFRVVLTAKNAGKTPMHFVADGGAPARLSVVRYAGQYEAEVARYPKAETGLRREWTLLPGQSRSMPLTLTVEPNWPRDQLIRLEGWFTGRPDAKAGITISVLAEGQGEPATAGEAAMPELRPAAPAAGMVTRPAKEAD